MQRNQYLEALRLIADPEAQRAYERDVPIANVPAELVCMWFDDLAAETPFADLAPADAVRLQAFTEFFGKRVETLPVDGCVAALQASVAWREVMTEAKATLDSLEGRSADSSV